MADTEVVRASDGTFEKGVSGNPAGRPKGRKNEIVALKQDLEIAVRKHLPLARITKIIDKMATMAENGHVAAAKLLLDKVISNAREVDDVDEKGSGGITIRIENATFAAQRDATPTPKEAVEAEFTEVKTE